MWGTEKPLCTIPDPVDEQAIPLHPVLLKDKCQHLQDSRNSKDNTRGPILPLPRVSGSDQGQISFPRRDVPTEALNWGSAGWGPRERGEPVTPAGICLMSGSGSGSEAFYSNPIGPQIRCK